MFKQKKSPGKTFLKVVLILILLLGIAFLGYSVGKPIVQFLGGRERPEPADGTPETIEPTPVTTSAPITEAPKTEEPVTVPEPEPEPGKRILFVSIPAGGNSIEYISQRVDYARENGYYGISLELICNGGAINFATQNDIAVSMKAVSKSAVSDLAQACSIISDAGLVPYARISALTDNLASWDKSICYLFENSTSTWLDNSAELGGKPWISAFSDGAREYISSLCKEISDAGFAGIIAGELEFPPLRNSDLNYIGAKVKSAARYEGLIEFSNAVQEAIGGAKSYAVEADAQDIVSGRAEILKEPDMLGAQTVYVKYDSAAIGLRIVKTDESEIDYSGLSESDKLKVVMKDVAEALAGSGKTVIPAVTDEAMIETLVSMGYDERMIVVY